MNRYRLPISFRLSFDSPRRRLCQVTGTTAVCGQDIYTAETSSSSATRNDEPQPQAAITFGLSTLSPAPWRPSTKSITEERRATDGADLRIRAEVRLAPVVRWSIWTTG